MGDLEYKVTPVIYYFISSGMLDLLDLATDPQKLKLSQKQLTRQQLFNAMMLRLKQRNNLNQSFIKKFVKQALRKKNKLAQIFSCHPEGKWQGGSLEIVDWKSTNSIKCSYKVRRPSQCPASLTTLGEEKLNTIEYKQTIHTEETLDEDGKGSSLPIINYLQLSKEGSQLLSKKVQKQSKPSLNANKHTRNRLFKEVVSHETTIQKRAINKQAQLQKSPCLSNKNQINKGKIPLNIRTYDFGSQDIASHRKVATEIIETSSICSNQIEKFRFPHKYDTIDDGQSSTQKMKPFLPTIKKQYRVLNMNRKHLINHIRNNHQKLTIDEIEVFRNCQMNFETLTSKYEKTRNISSFQIHTIENRSKLD